MPWTHFKIFQKRPDENGQFDDTFGDRVMKSNMEIMGIKMGIGQIETFYPSKNGKILKLNVSYILSPFLISF